MGRCTDAAVAAIPEPNRPALYHVAVDAPLADFYREALKLNGQDQDALPLVVKDHVDLVLELTPEEVQMKLRAIDGHQSQLEICRLEIRTHPHLLQQGYGREPYMALSQVAPALTAAGLLGEFAEVFELPEGFGTASIANDDQLHTTLKGFERGLRIDADDFWIATARCLATNGESRSRTASRLK